MWVIPVCPVSPALRFDSDATSLVKVIHCAVTPIAEVYVLLTPRSGRAFFKNSEKEQLDEIFHGAKCVANEFVSDRR